MYLIMGIFDILIMRFYFRKKPFEVLDFEIKWSNQ